MEKRIRNFYDDCASSFDEEQDEFAFVRIPEKKIVTETLDKILNSNQTVLEIGAGTGRFTLKIAPHVKHITAIDISQNMLDCMTKKIEKNNLENIEQIHGSFMEIDLKDQFDLIVSFSAIEYIKDKEALYGKIADLLKPGGKLILTTAHNTFFRWWGRLGNYFRQKIFMAAYSKKKMRQLLTANGLNVVEMRDLCLKSLFTKGILLFVHAAK
jgi:ubiquinone/menaquinone biosynthesis C-methylase UbiE